jgi:hypothetical protein
MKAKCIENMGIKLSQQAVKSGYTQDTIFHLTIGDTYTIYGINDWRGTINYLTMNANNTNPIWSPAELFQLVDYRLPPNWYYKFLTQDPMILNAIMGYKELAMEPKHHDGLIGEDREALKLFYERKKEIDAFHK